MRDYVLTCVTQSGPHGVTLLELARRLNKTPNSLSGRFTELAALGLIERRLRDRPRHGRDWVVRDGAAVWFAKATAGAP
jgi:predicted transcriptional regulator